MYFIQVLYQVVGILTYFPKKIVIFLSLSMIHVLIVQRMSFWNELLLMLVVLEESVE